MSNRSIGDFFDCCGDEDLFPFKCRECGRPLVLCYECDTLYVDLNDLTARQFFDLDQFACPQCGAKLDGRFMRSPHHRITFEEWHDAGLDNLLIDREISELLEVLIGSANQLADFLHRGMRSTARRRITEFRNLAEALAEHIPNATRSRDEGRFVAQTSTLADGMKWHSHISRPVDQAYALLGITDEVIP